MTYKKNVVILRKEEWHVQEGGRKTRVKDDGRAGKREEERKGVRSVEEEK
jgi:hypothetical protein